MFDISVLDTAEPCLRRVHESVFAGNIVDRASTRHSERPLRAGRFALSHSIVFSGSPAELSEAVA
jgi:hypothetical protein